MRIEEIKLPNLKIDSSNMNDGQKRPLALVIVDGWGHSPKKAGNAIALAHTPFYDEICEKYPRTLLAASGFRVGLTPDAPGNSEVGHLNIGAGRIVQTDVSRISNAIKSGKFFENKVIKKALAKAKKNNSAVHLIGLLSDGEVHSSPETLFALLRMAKLEGLEDVFVHGILDGRDVPQRTADVYADAFEIKMADIGVGRIATLCGRYYAMDRSANWERTARVFTMLVHSEGERALDAVSAIRSSFLRGISDEFIEPIVLEDGSGEPIGKIKNGDVVIFFNHRGDRMRQLVKSLSVLDETDISSLSKPHIETVCLTEYDRSFRLPVAFKQEIEDKALAQIFAENGVLNCRITETEKYAHVTHFFNGGADNEHPCEQRVIVPSLKKNAVETSPEMSCFKVTDKFLRALEAAENDVFIVNLAASDMVAHSGNLEKTIEAVQYIDTCLGGIVEKIQELNGVAIITSDHGNCEEMSDLLTGGPNTAHTTNAVPFHLISNEQDELKLRVNGALEDIAPTILGILGLPKPIEMTGRDLREF